MGTMRWRNRTSITYPDGNIVHYQYDALKPAEPVTDWSSQTTTSGTYAAGNLVVSRGVPERHVNVPTSYTPRTAARLFERDRTGTGEKVNSAYTYVMDKVGNRWKCVVQRRSGSGMGMTRAVTA